MGTLLVKNATALVTIDERRREIRDGGMFIRDGWIEQVDESAKLPSCADHVVDLSGHIVFPGLINAHHHLFQTLHRGLHANREAGLSAWLNNLYPRWSRMSRDDVRLAATIGLAELAISGCTTVADHQYLWPNGNIAEDQFEVAAQIGMRFHLGRGFQDIGEAEGGFAPSSLVENDEDILEDCERVIDRFHDPAPGSFSRVFIAPSSVRSVSEGLFRDSSKLARRRGVGFHLHLGETREEIDFVQHKYHCRPVEFLENIGGLGEGTWIAHGVHLDDDDIERLRRCHCGVCHCPSSNMILGSGIAPIGKYLASGLAVGLGVDGAASNDSSNLLAEMRLAVLLSRVGEAGRSGAISARDALAMATAGSAGLLGRSDIGSLRPGCAADFAAVRLDRLEVLGAEDPVAAISHCVISKVDQSWVHGRPLVVDGKLHKIDISAIAGRAAAYARRNAQALPPAGSATQRRAL